MEKEEITVGHLENFVAQLIMILCIEIYWKLRNFSPKPSFSDYLSNKLEALIPKLDQVDLSVKFAYPVPFTNNTIQFSVDEVLTLLNGEIQSGEKAFFARMVRF